MECIEPVIIILKNKINGKFHPAILSKNITSGLHMSEKMSFIYSGKVIMYQRNGYDDFKDAKKEIESEIINEIKDSKPCTNDYMEWDGKSLPSEMVFIETDIDGELYLVS